MLCLFGAVLYYERGKGDFVSAARGDVRAHVDRARPPLQQRRQRRLRPPPLEGEDLLHAYVRKERPHEHRPRPDEATRFFGAEADLAEDQAGAWFADYW